MARSASNRLLSVLDGFQSMYLVPSPALRMAEQDRAPALFDAAWEEVGRAIARVIRAIILPRTR